MSSEPEQSEIVNLTLFVSDAVNLSQHCCGRS